MKASFVPILGIVGHVIVNYNTKTIGRNGNFWLENLLVCLSLKTTSRAKLKFGHNMCSNGGFMHSELGVPGHVTAILKAENGQKVDEFKTIYLGKY